MKAKPVKRVGMEWVQVPIKEATCVTLNIPGPTGLLTLPVITKGPRGGGTSWTWNGDTEKPTLRPSVLTQFDCEGKNISHSWINDGQAQFLPDSTHELNGQTVALLDVP